MIISCLVRFALHTPFDAPPHESEPSFFLTALDLFAIRISETFAMLDLVSSCAFSIERLQIYFIPRTLGMIWLLPAKVLLIIYLASTVYSWSFPQRPHHPETTDRRAWLSHQILSILATTGTIGSTSGAEAGFRRGQWRTSHGAAIVHETRSVVSKSCYQQPPKRCNFGKDTALARN